MVSTHLKNMSQNGNLPQVRVKIPTTYIDMDIPCVSFPNTPTFCRRFFSPHKGHTTKTLSASLGCWEVNQVALPKTNTLQGINISHLEKRKIIFKMPFLGAYVSSLEGMAPENGWLEVGSGSFHFGFQRSKDLICRRQETNGCI